MTTRHQLLTSQERAPVVEPSMRVRAQRTSGEGAAVRAPVVAPRASEKKTLAGQLLRHNLTSPEKRTLKRIEALRRSVEAEPQDVIAQRIVDHLRADRGLMGNIEDAAYEVLAARLLDATLATVPAASVVGGYLREVGATERSPVTPVHVKSALRLLNERLYDLSSPEDVICASVREFRIEKRDGGLQVVGQLRGGASEVQVLSSMRRLLAAADLGDVDVRCEPPVVAVARVPVTTLARPTVLTSGSTRAPLR